MIQTAQMAFYLFTCSRCSIEFDVARTPEELLRPVTCPMDGSIARRAYGPPSDAQRDSAPEHPASWGGYLHDHGAGTEMHWHGASSPGSA